jgi:hypothetical protein
MRPKRAEQPGRKPASGRIAAQATTGLAKDLSPRLVDAADSIRAKLT